MGKFFTKKKIFVDAPINNAHSFMDTLKKKDQGQHDPVKTCKVLYQCCVADYAQSHTLL